MGFALGAADYLTKPVDPRHCYGVAGRHHAVGGGPLFLVVDDDPAMRAMLARTLVKAAAGQ